VKTTQVEPLGNSQTLLATRLLETCVLLHRMVNLEHEAVPYGGSGPMTGSPSFAASRVVMAPQARQRTGFRCSPDAFYKLSRQRPRSDRS